MEKIKLGSQMKEVNLYDFDNTIYDGESTVDFFLFCLKKKKKFNKICSFSNLYGITL